MYGLEPQDRFRVRKSHDPSCIRLAALSGALQPDVTHRARAVHTRKRPCIREGGWDGGRPVSRLALGRNLLPCLDLAVGLLIFFSLWISSLLPF